MAAYANVDLLLDQYADFRETYFFVDDDGTAEGSPRKWVTLGATATLEGRIDPRDPLPAVSISTTPNAQGSLTMGDDGSIAIVILRSHIVGMPTGMDIGYDLIATSGAIPKEALKGAIRVAAGNNRS